LQDERLQKSATEMLPSDQAVSRSGWARRLHYDRGSASDYTPVEGVLFNSAQLVREYFRYLGFCNSKMAPEPRAVHENNRQERIIFTTPYA
jgi:hypothetical protein